MRVALILFSVLVPGPAAASDLRLPPDQIQAGEAIYARKCASCHGRDAAGASAPDIQGILASDVTSAARGVENMPKVVLADHESEDIAVFLMSLAPDQAQKRLNNRQ